MYKYVRYAERISNYSPAQEVVLLVDQENNPIGSTTRREMRTNHLLHRSTFIYVLNPEGKLYVQMRTDTKDVYPSYYDPATGGVISASDPSDEISARRELQEELGIHPEELNFHFNYFYNCNENPVWCAVFTTKWDGELILQPEEVQWVELMTPQEIITRSQTEKFCPDGTHILGMLCEQGIIK